VSPVRYKLGFYIPGDTILLFKEVQKTWHINLQLFIHFTVMQ
jgi:hypothetical protein